MRSYRRPAHLGVTGLIASGGLIFHGPAFLPLLHSSTAAPRLHSCQSHFKRHYHPIALVTEVFGSTPSHHFQKSSWWFCLPPHFPLPHPPLPHTHDKVLYAPISFSFDPDVPSTLSFIFKLHHSPSTIFISSAPKLLYDSKPALKNIT